MTLRSLLALIVSTAAIAGAAACSDDSSAAETASCEVKVDAFKELMIVEESVIADQRSRNDADGPWSFRHAFENLMPEGADSSEFIRSWLENWVDTTELNGFKTDLEPRGEEMRIRLLCPWLKATPANACDDTCGTCADRKLDLAKAPFRLIAIVYRGDLAGRPGIPGPAGEARLVFAMTYGPGDDPKSETAALSLITEYSLPSSLSPKEWAEAWHQLGSHADFDESYKADLEKLTNRFVSRNASPERRNGSALAQVRTNESAFNWIWQLRQFRLDSLGHLRLAPLDNTPGQALNGSTALRSYLLDHRDEVLTDRHVLPVSMLAGSSDQLLYRWNFTDVDEQLRLSFARATCNGCHTGENPNVDTAFHISPHRKGREKLSQFVYDPIHPNSDELSKRSKLLSDTLCAK